ncbi:MAG: hypothetical protein C5B48_01305 [Candidatus Rokuibacteriota bacterium]|nr:MAG: hypothetical protein C5B48_01305 [Candidatus Rokubacteria bacterium]
MALPYLLNWFEPASHPAKVARPAPTPDSPAVATAPASPPAPKAVAPAPAPIVTSQLPPAPPQEKPRPTSIPSVPRATAAPVKSLPPVQVAKAVDASVRSDHAAVALPPRTQGVKAKSAKAGGGPHWVQVGLFKEARNADSLARQLRDQGFSIQIAQVTRGDGRPSDGGVRAGTYHVVRAGSFGDLSAAVAARASLSAKGHPGFLTEGVAR